MNDSLEKLVVKVLATVALAFIAAVTYTTNQPEQPTNSQTFQEEQITSILKTISSTAGNRSTPKRIRVRMVLEYAEILRHSLDKENDGCSCHHDNSTRLADDQDKISP